METLVQGNVTEQETEAEGLRSQQRPGMQVWVLGRQGVDTQVMEKHI